MRVDFAQCPQNANSHAMVTYTFSATAMSFDHKEETQVEVQDFEAQVDDDVNDREESIEMEGDEQSTQAEPGPKKQERKEHRAVDNELIREPGKSLLPFARVQKIIKADKVSSGNATFVNCDHK